MSEFIPSVGWELFKKLVDEGKVEEMKSCEVIVEGEHKFSAIIFHGDNKTYGQIQAEQLGLKTNIVGGKDPEELIDSMECPDCGFISKSEFGLQAHRRKHKKELAVATV